MSDIYLYNSLSRSKEKFIPLHSGQVSMYHCGPTVYNNPHIGNLRSFIFADLVRRTFEYNCFDVRQVMNITDIDDKTIKGSQKENLSLHEFTHKYEKIFLADLEALNIKLPRLPHATEYIAQMVSMIEKLLANGTAYKTEDGVYFSISKFANYGQLAKIDLSKTSTQATSEDEYDKENAHDFALWKFRKPEDGDNFWPTPFGEGRPGWHIECSAMATSLLGETIDIHTGGEDLMFPHHTNEIAQSECTTGKKFVRYWMHGGFINVSGEKMAKSKGNFTTLDEIISSGFRPLDFRYLMLTVHYRSKLEFSTDSLTAAKNAREKLSRTISNLPDGGKINTAYTERFGELISDDLNYPEALALVWILLKDDSVSGEDKKKTILYFDKTLSLRLGEKEEIVIPENVLTLAEKREEARKAKNWAESDRLRDEIKNLGFTVKDSENGFDIEVL